MQKIVHNQFMKITNHRLYTNTTNLNYFIDLELSNSELNSNNIKDLLIDELDVFINNNQKMITNHRKIIKHHSHFKCAIINKEITGVLFKKVKITIKCSLDSDDFQFAVPIESANQSVILSFKSNN